MADSSLTRSYARRRVTIVFAPWRTITGGTAGIVEAECGHRIAVLNSDLRVDDFIECEYCARHAMAAGNRTHSLEDDDTEHKGN